VYTTVERENGITGSGSALGIWICKGTQNCGGATHKGPCDIVLRKVDRILRSRQRSDKAAFFALHAGKANRAENDALVSLRRLREPDLSARYCNHQPYGSGELSTAGRGACNHVLWHFGRQPGSRPVGGRGAGNVQSAMV